LELLGIVVDTLRQLYLLSRSKACQDLPTGQTSPPEGDLAQDTMCPTRHSAVLWTWKFGVLCGHICLPAPVGPLRLCKRRELESAIDAVPPEFSRLGVVGRPSQERARGLRNLGRFPIRDPREVDASMEGWGALLQAQTRNEDNPSSAVPRQGPRAPDLWDVRTHPRALVHPALSYWKFAR
jgi:hypothetical protein